MDELAQLDAGETSATLAIAQLQTLNPARAKNLSRYFLDQHGAPMRQTVQLDEVLHQLLTARQDAAVCVEYGDWQVRRYQGNIHALPALPDFKRDFSVTWQGESELDWPPLNARLIFQIVGANLFARFADDSANLSHLQPCIIPLDKTDSLTLRSNSHYAQRE